MLFKLDRTLNEEREEARLDLRVEPKRPFLIDGLRGLRWLGVEAIGLAGSGRLGGGPRGLEKAHAEVGPAAEVIPARALDGRREGDPIELPVAVVWYKLCASVSLFGLEVERLLVWTSSGAEKDRGCWDDSRWRESLGGSGRA